MQNTIYQWFLFVCLLFLPMNSEANIDTKTAMLTPLANPVFSQAPRHFLSENSTERFGSLKKWAKLFEKNKNTLERHEATEGSSDAEQDIKEARKKRVFKILLFIVLGLVLIYFLQGKFLLTLVTLAIILYWRNRNKIKNWERDRYERMNNPEAAQRHGISRSSLQHPANKWTRRAVNRYLIGLAMGLIGLIFLLVGIASSEVVINLAILILSVGYIFSLVSFANSIRAIMDNEPQSMWAWLIALLGLPGVVTVLGLVALIGTF